MRLTHKVRVAWVEGTVNQTRDHLEIHYGESRTPVARIAQRKQGGFTVQFLLKTTRANLRSTTQILAAVRQELTFYLLDAVGPDSWSFAQYHCTTPANHRSIVHWSWHPQQDHSLHDAPAP